MFKIWSMEDGKELFKHDIGYGVNSVDFSKDGEYLLAASGDRTIRVWSLSDHTSLAVLVGDDVTVNNAVFNSTSTLVHRQVVIRQSEYGIQRNRRTLI